MPRRARIVVPGCAHHVTQRGNRQASVYRDEEDRLHYKELLRKHCIENEVWLWSYTLMTNHVHAIAMPQSAEALSLVIQHAHSAYAKWFNKKYGLSGHLWQGRFYSCVLSEGHLWAAVRYVERNPVRAGIVKRAEDYPWSSARAHVFGRPDFLLDPGLPLTGVVGAWAEWLAADDSETQLQAIRKATAKDIPFGEDAFIDDLEKRTGRQLRPGKPGRKPKHEVETRQSCLALE